MYANASDDRPTTSCRVVDIDIFGMLCFSYRRLQLSEINVTCPIPTITQTNMRPMQNRPEIRDLSKGLSPAMVMIMHGVMMWPVVMMPTVMMGRMVHPAGKKRVIKVVPKVERGWRRRSTSKLVVHPPSRPSAKPVPTPPAKRATPPTAMFVSPKHASRPNGRSQDAPCTAEPAKAAI